LSEGRASGDAVAGILWTAIAFSGTLGLSRAADRERDGDALRALLLSPAPRAALYLGKTAGIVIFMLATELVVAALSTVLFGAALSAHAAELSGLLLLGTIGYAAIGGGIWTPPARSDFGADAPRIYLATGFRDYMFRYLRDLYFYLDSHAFPFQSKIFFRKSDAGHELYGWHYRELFDWLDRGAAPLPAPGTADGWTLETTLPATDGLLHLARAGDGNLIGAAANGQLWRRIAATGAWTQAATISNAEGVLSPMSSVCMLPSGHGVAVGGDGMVALTDDQGASWRAAPPAPEAVPPSGFGYSYLTALGCTGNRVVGTGYWAASVSDDAGLHWMAGSMSNFGFAAQGAAVAPGPSGTWIAVGYWNYIGRSIDGVSFELRNAPQAHEWWNGVASAPDGHWWVVGDRGGILHCYNLIAFHRRLQRADWIDLRHHNAAAGLTQRCSRALADVAEARDHRNLARHHDVRTAADAVDERFAAAVEIVEL